LLFLPLSFAPVSFLFPLVLLGKVTQALRVAVLQLLATILFVLNAQQTHQFRTAPVDPNIAFCKDFTAKNSIGEGKLDTKGDLKIQLVKIQANSKSRSK
jgi:hypothetical protein